jgi:hypothetical protein
MNCKKRFPANVTLDTPTFLNDKNIDAELYAFLQSMSMVVNGETVVVKKSLPTQAKICDIIKIKSPKTLRAHLMYLIEQGYVEEREGHEDLFFLPAHEDIFLMLPLSTVQYLVDTATENVVKTYIYLFQRFKWKGSGYVFTIEELGEHLGYKVQGRTRYYEMFNNILTCLENNGLITYENFFDGKSPRKRLLNVSEKHKEQIG